MWIVFMGIAALLFLKESDASAGQLEPSPNGSDSSSRTHRSNSWNLLDIDSSDQGANYKKDYDESFEKASAQTDVPFALLKAIGITESSLKPGAFRQEQGSASYGLMQVLWGNGTDTASWIPNRFAKYGYTADVIRDGSILYDPDINAFLGACVMRENLQRFKGNLRDAINAYNTGVAESKRKAPFNYVEKVLGYYTELVKEKVA